MDYQCKQGEKYALQELKSPKRVLTATVRTEGSVRRLLPVRTTVPIPKEMLKECITFLSGIRAKPVLKIGAVIVHNILGTGVDVVCTDSLLK
jgi:CxxC motif-containing protein